MTRLQPTTDSVLAIHLPIGTMAFVLAAVLASVSSTQAQTINVLHSFTGNGDGEAPIAGVTLDRAGNFYGTTSGEGDPSTVYKLTHAAGGWILSTLYTFNHPNDPVQLYGGVVIGPDGALYGTSYLGGQFNLGAVYALRPPATVCKSVSCPWTLTTLYNFDGLDGTHPYDGYLVFDSAGALYGTTYGGGAHVRGTVFKLTRSGSSWTESVLYSFTGGDDGGDPVSGVAFDSAGNLYGTTSEGGSNGYGTVFELSPSGGGWTETTLYTFTGGTDGADPIGTVAIDAQGNLYGTTPMSGPGAGAVWELSPSGGGWNFTVLHTIAGPPGSNLGPFATPTLDAEGNIYGTSRGTGGNHIGEVFKLSPTGSDYTYTSYDFDGTNGYAPYSNVTLDASGNLYGTTSNGGTNGCDCGVVWEITP